MKVSDYLVDYFSKNKLSHGFFMIGGALGHIADACARKGFKLYTMHHEQSAAFACEGQAIASNGFGLAMATSGPGATNLITGIGSAYYASLPCIFVTGQVNTFESNLTEKRRQVGFQETDIVSIVKPITKYATKITDAKTAVYEIEKAFFIANAPRKGPVLLDFPFDIQRTEISPEHENHFIGSSEHESMLSYESASKDQIINAIALISNSKRPIVLVGHGVRISNAKESLNEFLKKTKIPFVASLMGTDSVPSESKLYYGFIGTYANRSSNFALANSDLILVLGARLDSRQVGVQASKFAPNAKIIHVDIDKTELGASISEHLSICSDVNEFLVMLNKERIRTSISADWINYLDYLKQKYSSCPQQLNPHEISPNVALSTISALASNFAIASVDVGSHQMWFAQSWAVKEGQLILTNGGMGPMGCAIPTAIGAWLSHPKKPEVWAICGDGSAQVNIQDLQSLVRENIPMKIVILNNSSLGMLTQFQSENFEGRLIGSVQGYSAPDFVKIAVAYGLSAKQVSSNPELSDSAKWLLSQKGPALLDIQIPSRYKVYPKSSYALPVHEMKPLLSEQELTDALKYSKL
ncbi:MAG: thiamine pyrophosphate-binding protein [Candidatus Micrarchaeia archaeon]